MVIFLKELRVDGELSYDPLRHADDAFYGSETWTANSTFCVTQSAIPPEETYASSTSEIESNLHSNGHRKQHEKPKVDHCRPPASNTQEVTESPSSGTASRSVGNLGAEERDSSTASFQRLPAPQQVRKELTASSSVTGQGKEKSIFRDRFCR
ncbi:hypothetical protein FOXYSP1_19456 [Fusarium oxysporum f. sp. phaseoli]